MEPNLRSVILTGGLATVLFASSALAQAPAKNVILMIADGAGPTTWLAADQWQFGANAQTAPEYTQAYRGTDWVQTWATTHAGHTQPLPVGQVDVRLGLPAGALPPLLPPLWNEIPFPDFGSYDGTKAWDDTPATVNMFAGNPNLDARGPVVGLTPRSELPLGLQQFAVFASSSLEVTADEGFAAYDYLMWNGVTDSAAAGTALASGVRSYSSTINYDLNGQPVPFLTQQVKALGRSAGVVSTKAFTDATPAAFGTQDDFRDDEADISTSMINNGLLDVIITPGHPNFGSFGSLRGEPRYNVVSEADFTALQNGSAGWTFVDDADALVGIGTGDTEVPERLFGMLPVGGSLNSRDTTGRTNAFDPRVHDADNAPEGVSPFIAPDLSELSLAALEVLSQNEEGLFLMIEGANVDSAAHANNLPYLIEEMLAFNRAVDEVIAWIETNSSWDDTLLIVTTDHANGLFLGPNSDTVFMQDPIAGQPGELPAGMWWSSNHTGELVPVFAYGANADLLLGAQEGVDPVRGDYIHLSHIHDAMSEAMVVPEPSTIALIGLGGLVVAWVIWRRRR